LLILAVHGVENEPVHNARNNGEFFSTDMRIYLKTLNIINKNYT
jgi:hypothetical protein